jgi:hypothetical protein
MLLGGRKLWVNSLVESGANRVVLMDDVVEDTLHASVRADGLDDFTP